MWSAGVTDHITPWKAAYKTARILGDKTTFVLSNSGHLQSLLNPPTNKKASYMIGPSRSGGPDAFALSAEKRQGSWWLDWRDWLHQRSGEEIEAPKSLGDGRHPDYRAGAGNLCLRAIGSRTRGNRWLKIRLRSNARSCVARSSGRHRSARDLGRRSEADGRNQARRQHASAAPALFNGIGANWELAEPFLDALTDTTAIIFDMPGIGGSPLPTLPYRPSSIARLARASSPSSATTKSTSPGVSWGGGIAQQFAHQYPANLQAAGARRDLAGAIMVPGRRTRC